MPGHPMEPTPQAATSGGGSPGRGPAGEAGNKSESESDAFSDRPTVTFRNGRLAVTPVELDSVRAKRIRQEIPEALYESGKSQLSVRVPEDPVQRFPAVVKAADVLLAVTREAA